VLAEHELTAQYVGNQLKIARYLRERSWGKWKLVIVGDGYGKHEYSSDYATEDMFWEKFNERRIA
jgi:hypothetical protein